MYFIVYLTFAANAVKIKKLVFPKAQQLTVKSDIFLNCQFWPLFLYFRLFNTVKCKYIRYKISDD